MSENNKTKKKLSLSTIIFIALLTGAIFGILIHYFILRSLPDQSGLRYARDCIRYLCCRRNHNH